LRSTDGAAIELLFEGMEGAMDGGESGRFRIESDVILNVAQRRDALDLLRALPTRCSPLAFFDPQHRGVLDRLKFGNEGARQRGRAKLPAMTEAYIDDCAREIARVLKPGGYLMLWIDTFGLCEGHHLRIVEPPEWMTRRGYKPDAASALKTVDSLAWDSMKMGMGKRTRRQGDYLLILQKPPIRPTRWKDHRIRSRWREKVARSIHPHAKPIDLIARLIAAVTEPGDLVIDPAAGSFVVMKAAHQLGRDFVGCDCEWREEPDCCPVDPINETKAHAA
jgi:site-specific DNA-methyltransferase (adenine-specific)